MASRVVPLLNRIVVRKLDAPLKSAGGIILKETDDNGPQIGEVVSVGRGHIYENGKTRDMLIKSGQNVLLPNYIGQEITIDQEKVFIFRDTDILAVLD